MVRKLPGTPAQGAKSTERLFIAFLGGGGYNLFPEEDVRGTPMCWLRTPICLILRVHTKGVGFEGGNYLQGPTSKASQLGNLSLRLAEVKIELTRLGVEIERLQDALIQAEASEIILELAVDTDLLIPGREFLPRP